MDDPIFCHYQLSSSQHVTFHISISDLLVFISGRHKFHLCEDRYQFGSGNAHRYLCFVFPEPMGPKRLFRPFTVLSGLCRVVKWISIEASPMTWSLKAGHTELVRHASKRKEDIG